MYHQSVNLAVLKESDSEERKEYIYTQVCKRINQLTIELDKLRKALPACEAFIDQYKKKKQQADVMSATTATIKDDQVPTIQVDCKVRKHWKPVHSVVIDGGAGVNIMAEHTRRYLGITDMKEAPFRVRMADQRVVQPLGLIENIQVKAGGAKLSVSFLVLDVGDAYSMLLGRPWLKVAEAVHDWTTNTITLQCKGKKVVLSTDSKKLEDTRKPELLCQKQTPKQIERMLAAINIIPTADIDLNIVMADLEKAKEQRELFPDNFQESIAGMRTISKTGRKEESNDKNSSDNESETKGCLTTKQLQKKREKIKITDNTAGCKETQPFSSDDEDTDTQGMQEQVPKIQEVKEPVWMVPDDQAVEEWNLGTMEEPKTVRVNKNLPEEFKAEVRQVFEEFKDVFAWEHADLKGVDPKVCQHKIPLIPDAKPIRLQRYRMNPNYAKKVKEEIDNLLKAGFIAEVESSDWLFPIVVVPKKNGKLRVCVDYRKLNAQTVKDPFPLPFTDMMLDEVAGHQMYSFMDGYSGYNQLALAPEDREKTTFITEWGAFMYLVMPFGLCNAPATFQRCMMVIFADFLHKFLAIFVDDFTIYSQQQEHLAYLRLVFQRCREKRICLNPFKCVFCVWKGQLLGHIVSKNGMQMSADKVSDLINAKAPNSVTEVSSFLGYANFYRRFVEHFAAIAIPLYELTQKDVKFQWTPECQRAFEQLKSIIASEPILRQPNWDIIFHVHVDASGIALGSILAQPDGKVDFPVYFASRRFSKAEQGYSTTEREALGMVFSVQKFRHYLLGKLFHFYVDHQALLYLINKVLIQGRLMRWMLLLQEFDFKIFHKPGKNHHGADFLSRSAVGEHLQSIRDDPIDAELFTVSITG